VLALTGSGDRLFSRLPRRIIPLVQVAGFTACPANNLLSLDVYDLAFAVAVRLVFPAVSDLALAVLAEGHRFTGTRAMSCIDFSHAFTSTSFRTLFNADRSNSCPLLDNISST